MNSMKVNPNGNIAVGLKAGVDAAFGYSRAIYKNIRFALQLRLKNTTCPSAYKNYKQSWNLSVGQDSVSVNLLTKSGKCNGINSTEILVLGSGNLVPAIDLSAIIEGFIVALQLTANSNISFQGTFDRT